MQTLFLDTLKKRAEKFTNTLAKDAIVDWVERLENEARNKGLSPAEISRLADEYFNLFLAQELQYSLTRSMGMPNVLTNNHRP